MFNLGTEKSCSFSHVVDLLNEKLRGNFKPVYKENPLRNYVKDTRSGYEQDEGAGV